MVLEKQYLISVLNQIPRLLGLMDKNPLSKTYGCFDREFWHYATIDTPSARKQEAALTLALLYDLKDPLNPYYKSEKIKEFAHAAINYWAKIQETNGSFNEWYPKESSFVATSFTLYSITEAMLILNYSNSFLFSAVKKASNWISTKKEKRVTNQEVGSALALFNAFLITGEYKFKKISEAKVIEIEKIQNKEGWFLEYGGADIGYLSLASDYLAKLHEKNPHDKILDITKKINGFIAYFIHPNFSFGGIYGSRNTEYLIPFGFEYLSEKDGNAAIISSAIRKSVEMKSFPTNLDDRYLTQILYTWIQAYKVSNKKVSTNWHFKKNFKKNFKEAGIYILSNPEFYFITNYKKSGVFNLYLKKDKKLILDSGVFVHAPRLRLQSSWLNNSSQEVKEDEINIKGNFVKYKSNKTSPFKHFLIRFFQYTLGRNEKISLYVKDKLRNALITKSKREKSCFERKIHFKNKQIRVEDILIMSETPYKFFLQEKVENIYVPSSNYFIPSDLDSKRISGKTKSPSFLIKRDFANKK